MEGGNSGLVWVRDETPPKEGAPLVRSTVFYGSEGEVVA